MKTEVILKFYILTFAAVGSVHFFLRKNWKKIFFRTSQIITESQIASHKMLPIEHCHLRFCHNSEGSKSGLF
jgi:hypothetical protein